MVTLIEQTQEGAFLPFTRHPLFGAIALPTGGTGLVFLLEYLATPVMMTGPGRRSRVCRTSVFLASSWSGPVECSCSGKPFCTWRQPLPNQ